MEMNTVRISKQFQEIQFRNEELKCKNIWRREQCCPLHALELNLVSAVISPKDAAAVKFGLCLLSASRV
jgi:hypothetical protein